MLRIFALLLGTLLLSGCGTTQVDVRYTPPSVPASVAGEPVVVMGPVVDARKAGPNWLGAIRGGFGNPLKTLTTKEPVKDVVANAFTDALKVRGLLNQAPSPRYNLAVTIEKFDCSQMVRREAHADFVVSLTDLSSGRVVYSKTASSTKVTDSALFDTGVAASPNDLLQVALRAMNQAIDRALDAPDFQAALR